MLDGLLESLARRRDMTIKSILRVKELECDAHLPPHLSQHLRKAVLDAVNEYHEFAVQLMGTLDTDQVRVNQLFIEKLEAIYDYVMEEDAAAS